MPMPQEHKEPVGNTYTFAKTIGNVRPELETNTINSNQKLLAAQRLLDWLTRSNKSSVCIRQVLMFGPHSLRRRERVIDAAGILVANGWLARVKDHRPDGHKWEVLRRPVTSTIATQITQR
jgi:hypothetical protein